MGDGLEVVGVEAMLCACGAQLEQRRLGSPEFARSEPIRCSRESCAHHRWQPVAEMATIAAHLCVACPDEFRNLYAVAYNAHGAVERAFVGHGDWSRARRKLAELGETLTRYSRLVDQHFAGRLHDTPPRRPAGVPAANVYSQGDEGRLVVQRSRTVSEHRAAGGTVEVWVDALDPEVSVDVVVDAIEDQCDQLAAELVAAVRTARSGS